MGYTKNVNYQILLMSFSSHLSVQHPIATLFIVCLISACQQDGQYLQVNAKQHKKTSQALRAGTEDTSRTAQAAGRRTTEGATVATNSNKRNCLLVHEDNATSSTTQQVEHTSSGARRHSRTSKRQRTSSCETPASSSQTVRSQDTKRNTANQEEKDIERSATQSMRANELLDAASKEYYEQQLEAYVAHLTANQVPDNASHDYLRYASKEQSLAAVAALAEKAAFLLPQIVTILLEAYQREQGDYALRRAAIYALGNLIKNDATNKSEVCDVFLAARKDDHPEVREAAILAFDMLAQHAPEHRETALGAVMAMREDPVVAVRCLAIEKIGSIVQGVPGYKKHVIYILTAVIQHPNLHIRCAAARGLGQCRPEDDKDFKVAFDALIPACGDNSWPVLLAAKDALSAIAAGLPTEATMRILLAACQKTEDDVCYAIACAIASVVKTVNDQKIFNLMIAASHSRHFDTRYAAVEAFATLAQARREYIPKVVERFDDLGRKESDPRIQISILSTLKEIAHIVPEYAVDALKIALATSQNSAYKVRIKAIKMMPEVLKHIPRSKLDHWTTACLKVMQGAIRDRSEHVRSSVCQTLPDFYKVASKHGSEIIALLHEKAFDALPLVSYAAIDACRDLAKGTYSQAPLVVSTLLKIHAAINMEVFDKAIKIHAALGEVVEDVPSQAVLKVLLKAVNDDNIFIRQVVFDLLTDIINKVPAYGDQVAKVALSACEDIHTTVREYARELLKMLAREVPTQTLLAALIHAHKHGSWMVREAASNAIDLFTTLKLIEMYCSYSDLREEILPYMLDRLRKEALAIEGCQLTLHQSSGRPLVWSMSKRKIQHLQKALQPQKNMPKKHK